MDLTGAYRNTIILPTATESKYGRKRFVIGNTIQKKIGYRDTYQIQKSLV